MPADELAEARDEIAIQAGRDGRQSAENLAELLLLGAPETDLGGEGFRMPAIGDDHLVLAGCVPIAM